MGNRDRDGIQLHLDNRQIVSFVIGSLVVLGVVFALGVLVGKQLAFGAMASAGKPSDLLAAIDAKEKPRDSVEGVGESPTKPDALTYPKELTKPSTASAVVEPTKAGKDKPEKPAKESKDNKESKNIKDSKETKETKDSTENKESKDNKEVKDGKDNKETKEVKETKTEEPKKDLTAAFDKAAKPEPAKPSGGFTLQVASYPARDEADKLVARLTAKGLAAYMIEADLPTKGHVFRVRVGNYPTREDAEEGLKVFKKKSALPAIISNR